MQSIRLRDDRLRRDDRRPIGRVNIVGDHGRIGFTRRLRDRSEIIGAQQRRARRPRVHDSIQVEARHQIGQPAAEVKRGIGQIDIQLDAQIAQRLTPLAIGRGDDHAIEKASCARQHIPRGGEQDIVHRLQPGWAGPSPVRQHDQAQCIGHTTIARTAMFLNRQDAKNAKKGYITPWRPSRLCGEDYGCARRAMRWLQKDAGTQMSPHRFGTTGRQASSG